MFKFTAIILALVACAAAKPGFVAPLAYSAPLVAPGVVTATSSQVIARNYNGIAAPLVAAPVVASSPLAYTSSVVAPVAKYVSAPVAAAYHTPLTYTAPVATHFGSHFAYTAPSTVLL